jgi:hypothetical protein
MNLWARSLAPDDIDALVDSMGHCAGRDRSASRS